MVRKFKKAEMKKLKSFQIISKEKAIIYLREIITRTNKSLEMYQTYLNELSNYIEEEKNCIIKNIPEEEKKVDIKKYQKFINLLSSQEFYLLNIIGDHQDNSISYNKFRSLYKKKLKKQLLIKLEELTEKEEKLLKHFNQARNWYNHIPESLLTSEFKLIEENQLKNKTIDPIIIYNYETCLLEVIEDLYKQGNDMFKGFLIIYHCMLKDYSKLIGKEVQVKEKKILKSKTMEYFEATKLSFKIQTS